LKGILFSLAGSRVLDGSGKENEGVQNADQQNGVETRRMIVLSRYDIGSKVAEGPGPLILTLRKRAELGSGKKKMEVAERIPQSAA